MLFSPAARSIGGHRGDLVCVHRKRKESERHMAAKNFYFGKNADVVAGSANFAAILATDFASLGLTTGQQSAFGVLNTALQASWTVSFNPETRTSVTIEQRD
ncbi:MAG: hypothetical protein LH616_13370, partial [Ilumatobacteraceae bacterium]|nr:hypothetical protein [Ilumatobacteraceae bacterium]